jgi:hypothetical protein
MSSAVKCIIDDNGNKTSVLVPVKVWEDLNTNFRRLQVKVAIISGIYDGLSEVNRNKRSGKKLQTFKDF